MAVDPIKLARYAGTGFEVISPMVAGPIVGYYLDAYFRTDPILLIVMAILGFFAGFYRLFMIARDINKP